MPVVSAPVQFALLFLVAFLPPILYLAWVRGIERHDREPPWALVKVFLWGAIAGVAISAAVELWIGAGVSAEYDAIGTGVPFAVAMAVVVAPVVEEFAKPLGVRLAGSDLNEVEDGIVYGAAAGFGFAATENLLYQGAALAAGGIVAYAITVVLRTIASALLHGAATSLTGYGVALGSLRGRWGALLPYYLLAVLAHAAFNLLASVQLLFGLLLAVALALWVFSWTRRKLRALDRLGAPA